MITESIEESLRQAAICMQQKQFEQAQSLLQPILAAAPDHPVANYLFGLLAMSLRDVDYAEYYVRHALVQQPDYLPARAALANILETQGRLREAIEIASADASLGQAVLRMQAALDTQAPEVGFKHIDPHVSPEILFEQAQRLAKQFPPQGPMPKRDTDPDRTLRVGFVSGNLHQHPVGFFIESALAAMDPTQWQLYFYYNKRNVDAMTARLKSMAAGWRDVTGVDDDTVHAQIQKDAIDILIDLAGYTNGNRLAVFARRAAPVQMTWVGYYDTTAIPAMDYIISDEHVLPQELESYFTETPLHLPDSYLCFAAPDYPVEVNELPALSQGKITFGSFNKVIKINEEVIAWWSGILKRVPDSRIMLLAKPGHSPRDVETMLERFESNGISRDRILLKGRGQRNHMLERYHEIDIALDPFPYNGGTTTAEALWMGVPVVNCIGEAFVSRVGVSMLSAAGFPEWCATTRQAYEDIAVKLASDLPALATLRRSLRDRVRSSPLMDAPRFARNLEMALRQAWVKANSR